MAELDTYTKAPIREAISAFTLDGEPLWDNNTLGRLFAEFKNRYPGFQPVTDHAIGVHFGQAGHAPVVSTQPQQRTRFTNSEGEMIDLRRGLLSIHRTRPYPGWQAYRNQVTHALETYRKVGSGRVQGLGLRYINELSLPADQVRTCFPYLPPPIPGQPEVQSLQVISDHFFEDGIFLRSIFVALPQQGSVDLLVALDHDMIAHFTEPVEGDEALAWLDDLHERHRSRFEASISEALREKIR